MRSVHDSLGHEASEGRPGSRRRRSRMGVVVPAVLVLLLVVGAVPRIRRHAELMAASREARSAVPTVVVTRPRLEVDSGLTLPGSVEALTQAIVQARTSGYVKERRVDIGDRVVRGQVLAVIEAPEVDQTVEQARADLARATATTSQASSDLLRLQAGVGQARAQVARAQAALAQARATEASNRARLYSARSGLQGRRGDLVRARANLELARKTWARYRDLGSQGFVTEQDVDNQRTSFEVNQALVRTAEMAVTQAQADVDAAREVVRASQATVIAARADVESADTGLTAATAAVGTGMANVEAASAGRDSSRSNLRRTQALKGFENVTAPFTGVITARNVDEGSLVKADNIPTGVSTDSAVAPQGGLFGIARTDVLRVRVALPQSYVPFVRAGTRVSIAVREAPGRVFAGVVKHTAGALDPVARSLQVEVYLPNPEGRVLPGMYAEVGFPEGTGGSRLTIPGTALMAGPEGTRVLVVDGAGTLHWRKIGVRRDLGATLEIATGLAPTDVVVDNPSLDLVEGTRVEVSEAPASPAPGSPSPGGPAGAPSPSPGGSRGPAPGSPDGPGGGARGSAGGSPGPAAAGARP